MWFLKVDINLLNQYFKSTDWLADWLSDWLKHFGSQGTQNNRRTRCHSGTQSTWAIGALGHLKSTRALGHLRHRDTQRALGNSGTQGTWELRHSGTWHLGIRKTLGRSFTQALGNLGTLELEALEALYLANSPINLDFKIFSVFSLIVPQWRLFSTLENVWLLCLTTCINSA